MKFPVEFEAQLRAASLEPAAVLEHGGSPAEAHAASLGQDPTPWLEPVLSHALALGPLEGVSLWSVTHFVVPPLLTVAGPDAGAFARLLRRVTSTLLELHRHGERGTRFEQYAVRVAAGALRTPAALGRVLELAERLAKGGVEPGFFVQLLAEPLAQLGEGQLELACVSLERCANAVAAAGLHVGYPFATGLKPMVTHPHAFELRAGAGRTNFELWLEALPALLRAAGPRAYGLCEYGVHGLFLGELDGLRLSEALTLALTMFDHGLEPGPTLAQGLRTTLHLDVATRLAEAGVDPFYVCTQGLSHFEALGWLADGGDRLVQLALEVHRNGHRVRLLFEDGLDVLPALEHDLGGLALRALELVEGMVKAGLEPGVTMRWSLPRAVGQSGGRDGTSPTAAEVLDFAHALVAQGVDPSPALGYAIRPLAELSSGDPTTFATLSRTLVALMARLTGLGVDLREILFHDVPALAEAGGHSKAFVELLTRVATLVEEWSARGFELKELLGQGLPAAAREARGRPWALAGGLELAIRLGREGRPREAVVLLETGLSTALATAADDEERFRRALDSVEARYAQLPAELTASASLAAIALAGTDVARLEVALQVLVEASKRHGAALLPLAKALPALAECADDPAALGSLLDVAVRMQASLGPAAANLAEPAQHEARGGAAAARQSPDPSPAEARVTQEERVRIADCWRDEGIPLVRQLVGHLSGAKAPAASTLLGELATWLGRGGADRCDALRHARSLGRIAAPPKLVPLLERARVGLKTAPVRELLLPLLELASDEATWVDMMDSVPPLLSAPNLPPGFENGLARLPQVLTGRRGCWSALIGPTLQTAKVHAGPLLDAFAALGHHLGGPADWDVLRELVTQRGVRATDTLWSLVVPAVHEGILTSLSEHRDSLQRYLREVGFADPSVYAHFLDLLADQELAEATRRERIASLTADIGALTAAIRTANLTPELEAHPLFFVALQHVFPPSVSATRRVYEQLYRRMDDRPEDVRSFAAFENPSTLEVSAGSYQLKDEAVDRSAFAWFEACLPVEGAEREPEALLGWELVSSWAEGRLAREPVKAPLIERLLRRVPEGERPTGALGSAKGLLAIRALAADRLQGLVEDALLAARAEDPARFERLVRTKLAPPPRVGSGLVKSVSRTLEAVRGGSLDAAEAVRRLSGQLQAFDAGEDVVHGLLSTPLEAVRAALEALPARPVALEPAKEVARVHGELVGQHLQRMNEVLASELVWKPSSDVLRLRLELTKRRAHVVVGLTEGVCVVHDEALWKRPEFCQVVFWNEAGVAQGGLHLLTVEDEGRRYLSLPGINPTLALLEQVDAPVLLRSLLEWTKALAKACGYAGVWIPTARGIHSNRHAMSRAIEDAGLEVRRTREHPFSYSPYAYRFDEVYEASLR